MDFTRLLLRLRGASAVTDPEVAQVLRLSDTQVMRIKDLRRQNSSSLRTRLKAMLRGGRRDVSVRDSLRELSQEAEQSVISLLSAEQQQKLARLTGK